jgi:hypothetical protein
MMLLTGSCFLEEHDGVGGIGGLLNFNPARQDLPNLNLNELYFLNFVIFIWFVYN